MRALTNKPITSQSLQPWRMPRRGAERLPRNLARSARYAMRAAPDTTGCGEKWVTKRVIAAHLGVSIRFIETQHNLGLPVLRIGGTINRYQVSEVEAWMRDYYSSTPAAGDM